MTHDTQWIFQCHSMVSEGCIALHALELSNRSHESMPLQVRIGLRHFCRVVSICENRIKKLTIIIYMGFRFGQWLGKMGIVVNYSYGPGLFSRWPIVLRVSLRIYCSSQCVCFPVIVVEAEYRVLPLHLSAEFVAHLHGCLSPCTRCQSMLVKASPDTSGKVLHIRCNVTVNGQPISVFNV